MPARTNREHFRLVLGPEGTPLGGEWSARVSLADVEHIPGLDGDDLRGAVVVPHHESETEDQA